MGLLGEDDERAGVHGAQRTRSGAERGQARGLVPRPACGRSRQVREAARSSPSGRHVPATCAVDEERADRLRHLGVEDPRAVLLGQDQRAARVGEQVGVPGAAGSAPARACRRPGSGRSGRSSSSVPSSAANRRSVEAARAPARRPWASCPPSWRCPALRGRPEAGQVAARRGGRARRRVDVRRPEPVLGEPVEVGAAALPRARRRDAHQVEPQRRCPRAPPCRSAPRSPSRLQRAVLQRRAQRLRRASMSARGPCVDPQPPARGARRGSRAPAASSRPRETRWIVTRISVALDDLALLERLA